MLTALASKLFSRPPSSIRQHTINAVESVRCFLNEIDDHPQDLLIPRLAATKTHLLRPSGKLVRPLIVSLLARALGVPDEEARPYALITELIHAASLLHDDVIDRADRRRDRATANVLYDNTLAVLAGDGLLAEVTARLAAAGDLATIRAVSATIQDLVAGEAWQYDLRGEVHDDVQTCIEVAELKTGSLLSLCTWIPAHLAGLPPEVAEEFGAIGRYTGVSFQLIDDLLDFFAAETGKPQLGDWQEFKTNAMTALLVGLHPSGRSPLQRLFRSAERPTVEQCLETLHENFPARVVEQAASRLRALAEEYAALAAQYARRIPDNDPGRTFEQLRRTLIERKT